MKVAMEGLAGLGLLCPKPSGTVRFAVRLPDSVLLQARVGPLRNTKANTGRKD